MRIVFTLHAILQIEERKLNNLWVEETIKYPDVLKREDNKYYAIKKLNGLKLKVVYVKEKYIKVVTTYVIK